MPCGHHKGQSQVWSMVRPRHGSDLALTFVIVLFRHLHCPPLSLKNSYITVLCWFQLSTEYKTLEAWVQHSAVGYWTSSQTDPRQLGLAVTLILWSPPGLCAQRPSCHYVHPWLHTQASSKLYYEVCRRHYHHRPHCNQRSESSYWKEIKKLANQRA